MCCVGDTHHEGHLRKRKTSLLRESFLIKIKKKQPTVSTVGYQIKRDQTILMVYLYLLIPIFAKQKIMCCVGDKHYGGHLRKRKISLWRESFLINIKKKTSQGFNRGLPNKTRPNHFNGLPEFTEVRIFAKQKIMCCVGNTHHRGHLRKRRTSLLSEGLQTQKIMNKAEEIKSLIKGLNPAQVLALIAETYKENIVFSTSFGWEDQVLTQMIFTQNLPVKVFTLETGRMFSETYYVWQRTLETYNKPIQVYFPDKVALENMLSLKGPSSFYESVENRKECCGIRKVEPLNRALLGAKIWITGIRAEQSANREDMDWVEWDEAHQLVKIHPIFNWTFDEVKAYVKLHNIPYNPLHDRGFPSIGCQPCTRAVAEGEDFRAGRWWWEDADKKECGLHE